MRSPWLPWVRDPVLLAERRGRWRWPWALLGTFCATLGALVLLLQSDALQIRIAAWTGTQALYRAAQRSDVILLPGNAYTFAALGLFGASLWFVAAAMMRLHGRRARDLWRFHGQGGVALFLKAAAALATVALAGYGLEMLRTPAAFQVRSDFGSVYLLSFAFGLCVIALQTLGEELLFRGYLLRAWGALVAVRAAIVALLVLGFTMLHTLNSDFKTDFIYNFIWFVATEVLYYWLVLRSGSVASTWGLHFANNVLSMMVIVTVPGSAPDMGLNVYSDPVLAAGGSRLTSPMAYVEMVVGIALLVALLAWKRSPFYVPAAPLPVLPGDRPVPAPSTEPPPTVGV